MKNCHNLYYAFGINTVLAALHFNYIIAFVGRILIKTDLISLRRN